MLRSHCFQISVVRWIAPSHWRQTHTHTHTHTHTFSLARSLSLSLSLSHTHTHVLFRARALSLSRSLSLTLSRSLSLTHALWHTHVYTRCAHDMFAHEAWKDCCKRTTMLVMSGVYVSVYVLCVCACVCQVRACARTRVRVQRNSVQNVQALRIVGSVGIWGSSWAHQPCRPYIEA